MELAEALEQLQNDIFDMEETFYSDLAGDVTAEYQLMITDAETVLDELNIDPEDFENYSDLYEAVESGLYDCVDGGLDGVTPF